ncbi:MAG: hypothetical protein AB7N80_11380 [Bdellovibrionales bacterium]
MGTWKVTNKILGLILIGLSGVACSEVAFTPAPIEQAQQGPIDNGNERTDTFYFNAERPPSKVDVLFIVDNSGSMAEEQARLSTALSSFVDTLADLDWQIGITTTDLSGGAQSTNGDVVTMVGTGVKVLNKRVPNYEQVFLDTVLAHGTTPECAQNNTNCASGDEQALGAARLAVTKRNTTNYGFFRANSDFIAIALTDEDERSNGGNGATTPTQLISTVNSAWGLTKLFSGYGIIVRPGDTACINAQAASGGRPATFVQQLADMTDGVTGSICDTDYGPALANIGTRVRRYATSIMLSDVPVAGTVQVTLTPANPSITWIVVGQTVRLSDLPARGTRVDVTYERAP